MVPHVMESPEILRDLMDPAVGVPEFDLGQANEGLGSHTVLRTSVPGTHGCPLGIDGQQRLVIAPNSFMLISLTVRWLPRVVLGQGIGASADQPRAGGFRTSGLA